MCVNRVAPRGAVREFNGCMTTHSHPSCIQLHVLAANRKRFAAWDKSRTTCRAVRGVFGCLLVLNS